MKRKYTSSRRIFQKKRLKEDKKNKNKNVPCKGVPPWIGIFILISIFGHLRSLFIISTWPCLAAQYNALLPILINKLKLTKLCKEINK